MSLVTEYETVSIRLDWPVICRLACKAMIEGCDFETICNIAFADRLAKEDK